MSETAPVLKWPRTTSAEMAALWAKIDRHFIGLSAMGSIHAPAFTPAEGQAWEAIRQMIAGLVERERP